MLRNAAGMRLYVPEEWEVDDHTIVGDHARSPWSYIFHRGHPLIGFIVRYDRHQHRIHCYHLRDGRPMATRHPTVYSSVVNGLLWAYSSDPLV